MSDARRGGLGDGVIRAYDGGRDRDAVVRVQRDCGFLPADPERSGRIVDLSTANGMALVTEVDGTAECFARHEAATLRWGEAELPWAAVGLVATSAVARQRGLAGRITARLVANQAAAGFRGSTLGVFDQGFYERLGFGPGTYDRFFQFDPSTLRVPRLTRSPRRLTAADAAAIHASRRRRWRRHGAMTFDDVTQTEQLLLLADAQSGFGLGFEDPGDGRITHMVWFANVGGFNGPYVVKFQSFEEPAQVIELLSVLRSLGDQVRMCRMYEPVGVQLQDLIRRPFHGRSVTKGSPYEQGATAVAWHQHRMLDVARCVGAASFDGGPVRFGLELRDPISAFLPADAPWRGVAGRYVVTLGPTSSAVEGEDATLPTLSAGIGAFTRLWLGVQSAEGLAVTDDLRGDADLLRRLTRLVRLPEPRPDWDY